MISRFTLETLEAIIAARARVADGSSYTARLVEAGASHAGKKLGEEAFETVIAALGGDRSRLVSESADLVYHLMVVWKIGGVRLADVLDELQRRTAQSGLQEKAARAHE